MPTAQRSARSRVRGDTAVEPGREVRLGDGTTVWLHALEGAPPAEGAVIVAEDAAGMTMGRAGYVRVYGPRAELTLDVAVPLWNGGLPEALVAALCMLAARQGISTFLARIPRADPEGGLRTLLVARFAARDERAGDRVDLAIATDAAERASAQERCERHDPPPAA